MALNPVDADVEAHLRGLLPDACFRQGDGYLTEPRRRWTGQGLVIAPGSTAEVSQVVKACAKAKVGIVPYGGGTGLVGGQIMPDGPKPVILSLERMRSIRAVYPSENVLVADAGCVLADVQAAAADVDRLFALSLASEGTAQVGGVLSTNAGGVNVLRYGNARAQCLGLEVVLANGDVWNGLTRLRKDNSGYDLRDLLIGAEGTLGIITGAALKLMSQPAVVGTAILAVASPQAALDLLALAADQLGDNISGFELMSRQGADFIVETGVDVTLPFADMPEWSVLIDVGLPAGMSAQNALEHVFETAYEAGLCSDGVIAQSLTQRQAFWALRENIPEGNRRIGSISSHDISLPLSKIPAFIPHAMTELAKLDDFRINCFGHLGDGNLHYNVFPPKGRDRADYTHLSKDIQRIVHDLVQENGGSFSAEHGVGRLKTTDLQRYGDPAKLQMMQAVKAALDPNGILNPGAVLATG